MSEEELIIGMAIGDGCITKRGSLTITHSITQKDYCLYKKGLLIDCGIKMIKDRIAEPSKNSFSINSSYYISTSHTSRGKRLRAYLYPNGKKIIPADLVITPQMWALIYQDNGRQNVSNHYNTYKEDKKSVVYTKWVNRYTIYTDNFDLDSIHNLQKSLLSYGIESSISYSNKHRYPHIHIRRKASKETFKNLILPYMCDSMMYKLNMPTYIISNK